MQSCCACLESKRGSCCRTEGDAGAQISSSAQRRNAGHERTERRQLKNKKVSYETSLVKAVSIFDQTPAENT